MNGYIIHDRQVIFQTKERSGHPGEQIELEEEYNWSK